MSDEQTTTVSDEQPSSEVTAEAVTTGTPAPTLSPASQNALAVLMNREKAVRTQESAVKAQAAELQALREQIESQKEPVVKDPTSINGEEIASLRAQLAEMQAREEDYRTQTVLSEEKARFRGVLDSAEGIDAVKAVGAQDEVFNHVVQHFNKTGEWLSEAQAAETVNAQLVDLYNKLHATLGAVPANQPPAPMDMLEVAKTLNQSMTSETGSHSSSHTLSDDEVNRQAAQMLRFKQR